MSRKFTAQELAGFMQTLNQKEANALTDADAWRTDIDTSLLRDLIKAAELGLKGAELAAVARTVIHLNKVGIIHLDPDTKRELDETLVPFSRREVERPRIEEPAVSL